MASTVKMLSITFIILCISSAAFSAQGGCKEPNKLIDHFLQSAKQNQEHDSSELQDVEVHFSYPGYNIKVSLSKGHVYGIVNQAQRQGSAHSYHKQGPKCYVEARFYYPRLQVEYEDVDIEAHPYPQIDAQSYKGYFYGVHAYFKAEYDENSDDLEVKHFSVYETSDAKFTLEGAEQEQRQNPHAEHQVQYHIKKAVSKALEEEFKQAAKEYSQDSSK